MKYRHHKESIYLLFGAQKSIHEALSGNRFSTAVTPARYELFTGHRTRLKKYCSLELPHCFLFTFNRQILGNF